MLVVTNTPRADADIVAGLGAIGVADGPRSPGTKGLMTSHIRPVWRGAHVARSALTCEVAPGDICQLAMVRPVSCSKSTDITCDDGYSRSSGADA